MEKTEVIRVFETFAGIGSQAKALKNIGMNFKIVATSEWFIDAIIGYDAIHGKSKTDKFLIDNIKNKISKFTLSNDSKNPYKNIDRINDEKLHKIYKSIINSNNLGSIIDIKGSDVPEHDILTYSFPCQDLSIAGKGKGIDRNSGTRSSLMWEIHRILKEIKYSDKNIPSFLLMENVPTIKNIKYKRGLDNFKNELSHLGYSKHVEIIINASKIGIPQRRKRYFMISMIENNDDIVKKLKNIEIIDRKLKYDISKIITPDMRFTNRENMYINSIKENGLEYKNVYTKLGVYPTFAQANIVTGYKHKTIGTVTFSGENSRQRIAVNIDNKLRVVECGGYQNMRLMGFEKADYYKLVDASLSDRKISALSGNSIVVQQLEEIFNAIFGG